MIIEKPSDIFLSSSGVCVNDEENNWFPIKQLRNLIITSSKGSISIPLLNELSKNNIRVFLCDDKKEPSCELMNAGIHSSTAGNLMKQISWEKYRKKVAWKHIVENKIKNQARLLSYVGNENANKLLEYAHSVEVNDETNREGQAARIYFSALFGPNFRRHSPDNINSALNYGYTILRTSIDRMITGHGYNTALGINHCSIANRFNFSCDIMEPFRPFVDMLVFQNGDIKLSWDYKKLLIGTLQGRCIYDDREMSIEDAAEAYFLDIIGYLSGNEWKAGDIAFER